MNRVVFEKLNRILGMCVHWRSSWGERERERERRRRRRRRRRKRRRSIRRKWWGLREFNDSLFIFRKEL